MRVTGGWARGRTIYAPKSDRIRITSDRVRESLFDILPPMEAMRFLDVYAGTGSVGIEALSRGGMEAVFVERESLHAGVLEKNLRLCGYEDSSEILITSAQRGVHLLGARKERFDIVFADPPYDRGVVSELLGLPGLGGLLTGGGTLVVEHSWREEVTSGDIFTVVDQRRYGDTGLSFLELRI